MATRYTVSLYVITLHVQVKKTNFMITDKDERPIKLTTTQLYYGLLYYMLLDE